MSLYFDPFLPEVLDDPYPTYHRLRSEDPVHYSEKLSSWVLTSYGDIRDFFFLDPRLSSDKSRAGKFKGERSQLRSLGSDPPAGPQVRTLLTQGLSPRTAQVMAPLVEQFVDDLLERLEQGVAGLIDEADMSGEVDLIAEFAYPLPIRVIAEMFGVPEEHRNQFQAYSQQLAESMDRFYSKGPTSGVGELAEFMTGLVAERTRNPGDDMISRMIVAESDGDRLSEREVVGLATAVIFAGHETTVNLIGNGMLALLRNPEQCDRLRDDGDVTRTAIEELLRFDSPAQLVSRTAAEDVEYRGKTIEAGDALVAMLGAANRDPQEFEDPDTLDLGREPNTHLAFGFGAHFCLGAALSRREGQIAIPALLRRFPKIRLADAPARFRKTLVLRGLEVLPVLVD